MNGRDRNRLGSNVHVYRGSFPLWLLLLAAPLGMVLLASLTLALVIGCAAVALILPLFLKRPRKRRDPDLIELDPSDYHVVRRSDRH
jgi:Flp pilus assembly protein TadB